MSDNDVGGGRSGSMTGGKRPPHRSVHLPLTKSQKDILLKSADSPVQKLIATPKNQHEAIPEKSAEDQSEYSEFLAPNAAPSEITRVPMSVGGKNPVPPKKLGWFKRMCVKIDTQCLKPLLVYKYTSENIAAMNEIEAMMDE